jgi:hypothetical protein
MPVRGKLSKAQQKQVTDIAARFSEPKAVIARGVINRDREMLRILMGLSPEVELSPAEWAIIERLDRLEQTTMLLMATESEFFEAFTQAFGGGQ